MNIYVGSNYGTAIRVTKEGSTVFELKDGYSGNTTVEISEQFVTAIVNNLCSNPSLLQQLTNNLPINHDLIKHDVLAMIKQEYMKSFDTILKD